MHPAHPNGCTEREAQARPTKCSLQFSKIGVPERIIEAANTRSKHSSRSYTQRCAKRTFCGKPNCNSMQKCKKKQGHESRTQTVPMLVAFKHQRATTGEMGKRSMALGTHTRTALVLGTETQPLIRAVIKHCSSYTRQ